MGAKVKLHQQNRELRSGRKMWREINSCFTPEWPGKVATVILQHTDTHSKFRIYVDSLGQVIREFLKATFSLALRTSNDLD